jgi:hypothetical protein
VAKKLGEAMWAGEMALHRMPCRPKPVAMVWVSWCSAALAAA